MTMTTIDLNADLGEVAGDYIDLLPVITTANVACGGHAGGGQLLVDTIKAAVENQVGVGAHPSYPDREGFGRVSMRNKISKEELVQSLIEQISEVKTELSKHHQKLTHIKAHGALYNDAMVHQDVADAMIQAAQLISPETPLFGLPNSVLESEAKEAGIPFVSEGFMDRAYTSEGTLVPRALVGAVLKHDDAVSQVMQIARDQSVQAIDGSVIKMNIKTVCVHADTPDAAQTAKSVRNMLNKIGIEVKAFSA